MRVGLHAQVHTCILWYFAIQRSSTTTETSKFTREFKVTIRLGKGNYGVVYGVRNKLDEKDYAVKIIKLNPQR